MTQEINIKENITFRKLKKIFEEVGYLEREVKQKGLKEEIFNFHNKKLNAGFNLTIEFY